MFQSLLSDVFGRENIFNFTIHLFYFISLQINTKIRSKISEIFFNFKILYAQRKKRMKRL